MYSKLNKQELSVNLKTIVIFIILAGMIFGQFVTRSTYLDEAVGIISMAYTLILFAKGKLEKSDRVTVTLMIFVVVIGLASNVASNIAVSIFSIGIDIIAETKVIWAFFAMKYFATPKTQNEIINILTPVSKIYCIIIFISCLVSQFINIGMTGTERYGLSGFKFIFPMAFQFLAVTIIAIGIIASNKVQTNAIIYYILAAFSLILSTKSSPIMFSVIFLFLCYYLNRRKKIKPITIAFIVILILLLGSYQIETYLLNENSPRYLFFYYAGKTANRFFPWGSGFATFGSDQAARLYSPLYTQYGFDTLFGMNKEDGSFLSDTFWPMAIGQFGWIGGIIYIYIYIRILFSITKNNYKTNSQKAFLFAACIQALIHAVGSAILSSSSGVLMFLIIGMFVNYRLDKGDNSGTRKMDR